MGTKPDGSDCWLIRHALDCFGDVGSCDHFSQVGSLLDLFVEDDAVGIVLCLT
jgi:hypothetical protein